MAGNCGCGRPIPPRVGPGKPRTKCELCSPSRSRRAGLAAVQASAGTEQPTDPTPIVGLVEDAARTVLDDLDSDHPAAGLLIAAARALARDVDKASEVRDRVAASRALLEMVNAFAPPPARLAGPPAGGVDDDEDIFGIGDVPPGVGDAQAP
jgi:hypothetical protein